MKKIIALSLVCMLVAASLMSCQLSEIIGKKEDTSAADTTNSSSVTTAAPAQTQVYKPMDWAETDISKYLKLGEYKGVEVTMTIEELTEEKYASEIQALLQSAQYHEQITDRAAAKGDTVNVDFKGFMDGVQFEGGTAQDQEVPLTDNSGYIEGFAEGIIGAKPGETVTVDITFPEDYYEDKAGKPVTFEITVNYIIGEAITPELNDEFVSTYTKGEYTTVAAFEEYFRKALVQSLEDAAKQQALSDMWNKILDSSEVIEYPEQQINYYLQELNAQFEYYAASYSMTVEQVMSVLGITEESMKEDAEAYTKDDMVLNSIVKAEGLLVSDEEYLATLADYAATAGVDSATFENYYGKDYIMEMMTREKVMMALYDMSKVTTAKP